jgi:hypothetical protein
VKNMAHESSSSRIGAGKPAADESKVVSLGELIAAAYDRAEVVTAEPSVVADLATRTVGRWLGRTGRSDLARQLQGDRDLKRAGRRTPYSRAA